VAMVAPVEVGKGAGYRLIDPERATEVARHP